jgi:hypothetical protein
MATRHGRSKPPARLRCIQLERRDTPAVTVLDYGSGFTGADTFRGRPPGVPANELLLTDGPFQARSVWAPDRVAVGAFETSFVFRQEGDPGRLGDGFTFALAGNDGSLGAPGAAGAGLGYQGLADSVAVKFDLVDNAGEGGHSVGVFTGGAEPTVPAVRLDDSPIHLHAQHPIRADLVYDGAVLTVTLTDTTAPDQTWTHQFPVDIPAAVGGPTAYAGFTAGTGELFARQAIDSWTFAEVGPAGPTITGLRAEHGTDSSIRLSAVAAETGGSGGLTYTWEVVSVPSGGSPNIYPSSVDPAAAWSYPTATGIYTFRLTVRDADGRTATDQVSLNHDPRHIHDLELSPPSATVPAGGSVQLTAVVRDQYGEPMPGVRPDLYVIGPGTITPDGLYTAPPDISGYVTVEGRIPIDPSRYQMFVYRSVAVRIESTRPPDPGLEFAGGFAAADLAQNGSAQIVGDRLRLTDGPFQAGSAYAPAPVDVRGFVARFEFQVGDTADGRLGDGLALVFQNAGPTALGAGGGGLGYEGIGRSVALKFDLVDNAGEGGESVGVFLNGAAPTVPAQPVPGGFYSLHSGHVLRADLTYDGRTLQYTVWDTVTGSGSGSSFAVDIPAAVGGPTAYAGFTAGTGELFAPIDILDWKYVPTDNWNPIPLPR